MSDSNSKQFNPGRHGPGQSMSQQRMTGHRMARGFTLIELLVVMTILSILVMIALPTFSEYVKRGYRAEARATMLVAAQYMERLRTESNSYMPGGAAPALPASLSRAPAQGVTRYNLTVATANATSYVVTATAVNGMAGDVCGNLTVDSTGLRGFSGSGGSFADCWQR